MCFKCKEGIYIIDDNPIRKCTEDLFYQYHNKHPIQIVSEEDININDYKILNEDNFRIKK